MTDTEKARRGDVIARVLQLRQKPNGRFDTTWGDKTPLGLYLTLERIMHEDALPTH